MDSSLEKAPLPEPDTQSQQQREQEAKHPEQQAHIQQPQKKRKRRKAKDILRIIWVELFENGVGSVSSVYVSVGDVSILAELDSRPLESKPFFTKRWSRRRRRQHSEKEDVVLKDLLPP